MDNNIKDLTKGKSFYDYDPLRTDVSVADDDIIDENNADPEKDARSQYLSKLMCFRKDELIIPEESDDEEENEDILGEVLNTEEK